jgi:3-hydroxyisobutyrate dehydrogenase
MNIGYVGLGNMGGALAARLQLTHKLNVFDLNEASVRRMVEQGAIAYSRLDEMAAQCDVIFMCLPTSDHVRTALFGSHGIASGAVKGSLIIDQTTGDPIATRAMAQDLAKQGVYMIDAPVSGGAVGATAGTIAIMVGADAEQFARIDPVLRSISPNIFHAGDVGAGQVIKLVNNLISGVQRLLTFEGIALAAKNGIDPAKACEILLAGGGKNAFMEKFMAPQIIKGKLDVGFTLGLMHKDVRLACQLGSDTGVPLFFGNLAREMYQLCISEKGASAEVHTSALVMDRMAGTHVVPVVPIAS